MSEIEAGTRWKILSKAQGKLLIKSSLSPFYPRWSARDLELMERKDEHCHHHATVVSGRPDDMPGWWVRFQLSVNQFDSSVMFVCVFMVLLSRTVLLKSYLVVLWWWLEFAWGKDEPFGLVEFCVLKIILKQKDKLIWFQFDAARTKMPRR